MPTSLLEAFLRIACAIVLDATALVIWDVGTRAPERLIADVRRGLGAGRSVVRGALRLVSGLLALSAAVAIVIPALARPADLTVVELGALVAALLVEQLIGPDLRARRR